MHTTTIRLESPVHRLRSKLLASSRSGSAKISRNHHQRTSSSLATPPASASGVPRLHYGNVRRRVLPESNPPQSNVAGPRSRCSNLRAPPAVLPFCTPAQRAPTDPAAVKLMDSLAREGFDLIAACHSHRTSGFADIARQLSPYPAFCFYGLGSLSSGVIYSDLEREGLLASIGLNSEGRIVSVEAKPIYLVGRGWGTIPTSEQAESILGTFLAVSREILDGSYEHGFYSDAGRHFLRAQWRDLSLAFNRAGLRGVLSKVARLRMGHLRTLFHSGLRSG